MTSYDAIVPAFLSEEHQAQRARVVGASEVSALFDLHPQLTRYQLWHVKAGRIQPPDLSGNERVEAGIFIEPSIAAWIAHRTGWPLEKFPGHATHPRVEGMGASPDYRILQHERGPGLVQIKNVDRLVYRDWNDEPPINYQLQLQHELACTDYSWGALGVLVGGNELRLFDYSRHEPSISRLEAEVSAFWRSIHDDQPPTPVWEVDLETIQQIHGYGRPGSVADLSADERLDELCAAYKAAGGEEKEAKARKEAAKAEILTLIGEAELAFSASWRVNAKNIAGGPVSYVRSDYRDFRIFPRKGKEA